MQPSSIQNGTDNSPLIEAWWSSLPLRCAIARCVKQDTEEALEARYVPGAHHSHNTIVTVGRSRPFTEAQDRVKMPYRIRACFLTGNLMFH